MSQKKISLLVLPSIENIENIVREIPVELTKAYYSSIEFIFKNNKVSILHNERDIKSFSHVWLSSYWSSRDLAVAVKNYLDFHGVYTTYVENSSSKLTDLMSFVLEGLICPDSYYIENSKLLSNIKRIEDTCGYPMIMKDSKGCGGENAEYISSREELVESINKRKVDIKYIFQRFIPNNYDWGILVANNEVVSGERSSPKKGEFRNNSKVGATEDFVTVEEIPQNVKDIAINASKALGLDWSRSDIVIDKNTGLPYLLEVNRFPGITVDSTEVSGATLFLRSFIEKEDNLLSLNYQLEELDKPFVKREIVAIDVGALDFTAL
ncbi:hypothetical protein HYV12_01970 [Candidatus Dojkabacteria bacterium]|nr:hypothetical protein [Candidatus Dojkabacteria bacterium]